MPECSRPFYAHGLCDSHYGLARQHPGETPEQLGARRRRARTPDEMREMLLERFVRNGDCWEWTGARDRRGYGNVRWDGRLWGAHRLAFHLLVEPVAPGIEVCHHCDNPPCIRPEHLFAGSHADNMADAARKGLMRTTPLRGEANPRARLTANDVRAIRESTERQVDLATRYGVGQPTISAIRCRKCWAHLPE